PEIPTFTVATAKAPAPFVPAMSTIPLLPVVAPRATMSGTAVVEAERRTVLSPEIVDAGARVFAQSKVSDTSVGGNAPVGVKPTTKLWELARGMSIGVFGGPTI